MTPEQQARQTIDRLLTAAGWAVQDFKAANLQGARGVALRELELNPGHGTADYLLYVDGKAAGIIEAKKQGATLTGVEAQSACYAQGLPAALPTHRRPLPFLYESTGLETHFANRLDPELRARNVFAQKITYGTTGSKPEELITAFRTSYYPPRIAVTVDMIATGTDIKPLEIVVFMRSVKSRSFFERMKRRGSGRERYAAFDYVGSHNPVAYS